MTLAHTRLQRRFRRRETGPGYVRFSPLSSSPSRFYHHRVAVWHRFLIELLVFSGWLETKEFVTNLPPPPPRCPSSLRPPFSFSFLSEKRGSRIGRKGRRAMYILYNFSFSVFLSLPHSRKSFIPMFRVFERSPFSSSAQRSCCCSALFEIEETIEWANEDGKRKGKSVDSFEYLSISRFRKFSLHFNIFSKKVSGRLKASTTLHINCFTYKVQT